MQQKRRGTEGLRNIGSIRIINVLLLALKMGWPMSHGVQVTSRS